MRTAAVRAVLGLVLAMGAVAIAAAPSLAEVRFGVAPSWLRLATSSGGGGSVEVRVQNTGDVALAVQALVRPFRDQAGDRSAETWLAVAPAAADVAPGDAAVFTVTIAVPEGLASGGRYATLLLETRPEAVDGNTTELAGRIEVPVWIAVRGDGEITRIPVLERFAAVLERDGRLGVRALLRNDGNSHFFADARIALGAPDGDAVAELTLPSRGILPGTSRLLAPETTLPLWTDGPILARAEIGPSRESDRDDFVPFLVEAEFSPVPRLALAPAAICENLTGGPTVTAALRNEGTIGLLPDVGYTIADGTGIVVATGGAPGEQVAWPGTTTPVGIDLTDPLPVGPYTLTVTATVAGITPLAVALPFSIGGDPATAAPLCTLAP